MGGKTWYYFLSSFPSAISNINVIIIIIIIFFF